MANPHKIKDNLEPLSLPKNIREKLIAVAISDTEQLKEVVLDNTLLIKASNLSENEIEKIKDSIKKLAPDSITEKKTKPPIFSLQNILSHSLSISASIATIIATIITLVIFFGSEVTDIPQPEPPLKISEAKIEIKNKYDVWREHKPSEPLDKYDRWVITYKGSKDHYASLYVWNQKTQNYKRIYPTKNESIVFPGTKEITLPPRFNEDQAREAYSVDPENGFTAIALIISEEVLPKDFDVASRLPEPEKSRTGTTIIKSPETAVYLDSYDVLSSSD